MKLELVSSSNIIIEYCILYDKDYLFKLSRSCVIIIFSVNEENFRVDREMYVFYIYFIEKRVVKVDIKPNNVLWTNHFTY